MFACIVYGFLYENKKVTMLISSVPQEKYHGRDAIFVHDWSILHKPVHKYRSHHDLHSTGIDGNGYIRFINFYPILGE